MVFSSISGGKTAAGDKRFDYLSFLYIDDRGPL